MKKLALFALLGLASLSFGKGWIQPWTPKLPAWESIVYSCDNPKPYKTIAADDFYLEYDLPVTNINWWGRVSSSAQLTRTYHVTIYKNDHCLPAWKSVVWEGCIRPYESAFQGGDCEGFRVWKMFGNVPFWNPLNLGPGHYWIQISESDADSVNPDRNDFWWSSHEPVVKCPALQADYLGNILQPLVEPCYKLKVDLAFELY